MKIGELAAATGIATSAIRFYEQSGLLPAAQRGSNGYRSYSAEAVQRLHFIQVAQALGFTLDTLRSVFVTTEGFSHAQRQEELMLRLDTRLGEIDEMLATLRAQRKDLQALRERVLASWDLGECVDPATISVSPGYKPARAAPARPARRASATPARKAPAPAPARRAVPR
jgi:DNA-binding transcriptional MerR regulator